MSRPAPVEAARPWAEEWMSIGVTGTNGKTSTVKLIGATLRAAQRPAFTVDTLEYRIDDEVIPVQRTWKGFIGAGREAARRGCRHAVIEVTSHALARGYARRWRYDLGVFTNLAHDHIAAHGSVEHYLAAKAQLFVNLAPGGTAILNAADKAAVMISRVMPADVSRLWYAAAHRGPRLCKADLEAMSIETCLDGTRVTLAPSPAAEAVGGALELQLVGDVFGENALAAAAAGLSAGLPGAAVRAGVAACPVVPGRFEVLARSPAVAIDYAHTADALARILDTARRLTDGRVIAVFGAGGGADSAKREPMGEAVGARVDLAYVTSDNPRDEDPATIAGAVAAGCERGGRARVIVELDRAAAITQALAEAHARDVVVIAGKGHETGQEIRGEVLPFSDRELVRALVRG